VNRCSQGLSAPLYTSCLQFLKQLSAAFGENYSRRKTPYFSLVKTSLALEGLIGRRWPYAVIPKGKNMKRIFLALLFLGVALSPWTPAQAQVDNTTCRVLTGDDHPDQPGFNELRRKVVEGFNRTMYRMCTEAIIFDNNISVKLNAPLDIKNDSDLDCAPGQGKPDVCGDGWGLVLDGSGGTIDVTGISPGDCAISLHASKVKIENLNITATAEQIAAGKVICDEGNGNDITGAHINGEGGPTPMPTPTANPTPTATPTPTESPLGVPTVLTASIDPSSTSSSLKVLLKWNYTPGSKGGKIHLNPGILNVLGNIRADDLIHPVMATKALKVGPDVSAVNPAAIAGIDLGGVIGPVTPDKDYNFEIERATKASSGDPCGTYTQVASINGKNVTYSDATVTASTHYCYRVRTARNSDHSAYSNVAEIYTPDPSLAIPTNLVATAMSEESIYVHWDFAADDTTDIGFQVERGNSSCAPESFTSVTILSQDSTHTLASILNFSDTGLMPNTTYCYRVRAVKATTDYSLYSNTDSATTLQPGATPLPTPVPTPTATPTATPSSTATPTPSPTDTDGDGIPNSIDNCPTVANHDQHDLDGDHIGDACDPDADGDGVSNTDELAHGTDPLNADTDGDGIDDGSDNCPTVANHDQADSNHDGRGDACSSNNGGGNNNGSATPNPSGNFPPGAMIGGGGGFCSLSMLAVPGSVPWVTLSGFGMLFALNRGFRSRKKK